ncbi:hypothetical protein N7456_010391 [Penicillium angulare]|uniref:F-box domain-containing protein n=1 Tax=Penicillium angulare TaxID=116970 RepID=A0A9W9K6G5_9EURO|nr:hypothetical protein N7456_010391 [Penicillium angulare]
MASEGAYLPTEVVMEIASWLDHPLMFIGRAHLARRQAALYNFCLVNRQWYSVGIEILYRIPMLWSGNSFEKFTRTICPSTKERRSSMKLDLGSLVRNLNLSKLVHQSSNSKTSRLLKMTSANLSIFTAPRVSFSTLDLRQVGDSSMSFTQLKKAISKLQNLYSLTLPTRMTITRTLLHTDPWPASLGSLNIGGNLDASVMETFSWPQNLGVLAISQCQNLSDSILRSILSNEQIQEKVHMLIIRSDCKFVIGDDDRESFGGLFYFDYLETLQIPVDLAEYFTLVGDALPGTGGGGTGFPAVEHLRMVSFGDRVSEDDFGLSSFESNFEHKLLDSLEFGALSDIWLLRITAKLFETFISPLRLIDDIIMRHVEHVSDEALDDWGCEMGLLVAHDLAD